MELIDCISESSKNNVKAKAQELPSQNQSGIAVLSIIQIALAADFARFENANNAKTLIQKIKTKVDLQNHTLTRSASVPTHRKAKISTSQPAKRATQKTQTSKSLASIKGAALKTSIGQGPTPIAAINSCKMTVNESTAKPKSSKLKKKIHKNQEVRKDHTKRAPEPCLLTTAQIPKMKLGERQKLKIRKLLLQRQIRDWNRPEEPKREGRELRHLH